MKKISRLFLAGSLATALFLGYGIAKADDMGGDNGGDKPAMGDQGGDHGDWGQKRIEHLKKKLELTDDQATQLEAALKDQMETNKPLRDQEKIDLDTLQQKVDSKASDSDLTAALDKLKADRKKMQTAQEKSMEKIRPILNPTQQAKWVLSMTRGMGRMGGKKPGDWKSHKDGGDKPGPKDAPAGN